MSKESEKVFRELDAFLAQHNPSNEEEMNELVQQFLDGYIEKAGSGQDGLDPEDAYDYLDLAENAKTKKDKLMYISRALELEPGNLDALLMQADFQAKKPDQFYDYLQPILREGERQMREGGYYENDTGDFWLLYETRPFMRVLERNFSALIDLGRMKQAVHAGENMLKLCTADNLGIRYRLMHLYAYLEDTAGAAQLHARYEDCDDPHLLLPLIVLYYKLEDLQTAGSFLSRLAGRNKNTRAFFSAAARDRLYEYYDELEPFGYQLGSIGELICCLDENIYLYDTVPCFFSWANQYLKQKKK